MLPPLGMYMCMHTGTWSQKQAKRRIRQTQTHTYETALLMKTNIYILCCLWSSNHFKHMQSDCSESFFNIYFVNGTLRQGPEGHDEQTLDDRVRDIQHPQRGWRCAEAAHLGRTLVGIDTVLVFPCPVLPQAPCPHEKRAPC